MNNKRKGPKSQKDISKEILDQLNKGLIESVNLTEWLCIDHIELIRNVLPTNYQEYCIDNTKKLKSKTTMSMIKSIGESLYVLILQNQDKEIHKLLKTHPSDTIRCWSTYISANNTDLSISDLLNEIKPYAADSHFGVREIAWIAVRESITNNLDESINILHKWAQSSNSYIRRFSTESIRPNGVWCKKIDRLKMHPEIALPILQSLKSDSSRYVQDSVANWLNDASKTRPDFVLQLCDEWQKNSTQETLYIIKRALRTIKK